MLLILKCPSSSFSTGGTNTCPTYKDMQKKKKKKSNILQTFKYCGTECFTGKLIKERMCLQSLAWVLLSARSAWIQVQQHKDCKQGPLTIVSSLCRTEQTPGKIDTCLSPCRQHCNELLRWEHFSVPQATLILLFQNIWMFHWNTKCCVKAHFCGPFSGCFKLKTEKWKYSVVYHHILMSHQCNIITSIVE